MNQEHHSKSRKSVNIVIHKYLIDIRFEQIRYGIKITVYVMIRKRPMTNKLSRKECINQNDQIPTSGGSLIPHSLQFKLNRNKYQQWLIN
jgi:hypothetical protein